MVMVVCSDIALTSLLSGLKLGLGSTVAKYAGVNVHRRLVEEENYKQGRYELAMKRAFLGTDEDLLASALSHDEELLILTINF